MSTTLKLYGLLAVMLIVGVIVLAVLRDDETADTSVTEQEKPAAAPGTEAPSKENASEGVKETIAHLREVIRQNPGDASALLELATLLQSAHAPGEAVIFYERGLRTDSLNVNARIDYVLCLFGLGRVDNALSQSREVIRLDPGNPKGLYNIGAIHANGGRRDSAEFYWNRLIQLHPDHEMATQARSSLRRLLEISAMQ